MKFIQEMFKSSITSKKTDTQKSIANPVTYNCDKYGSEYKVSGTKCIKRIEGEIIGYTCPEGYTLSGTKCTKQSSETIPATVTKQTATSYKYIWSECSYLEGWEFTGKTKVVTKNYTAGQK